MVVVDKNSDELTTGTDAAQLELYLKQTQLADKRAFDPH